MQNTSKAPFQELAFSKLDPTTSTTIQRSFSRILTIATPGNIAMCMRNTLG